MTNSIESSTIDFARRRPFRPETEDVISFRALVEFKKGVDEGALSFRDLRPSAEGNYARLLRPAERRQAETYCIERMPPPPVEFLQAVVTALGPGMTAKHSSFPAHFMPPMPPRAVSLAQSLIDAATVLYAASVEGKARV